MDDATVAETRLHYDLHSNKHTSTEAAMRARGQGRALPLKQYHNQIKRDLITRYTSPRGSLCDLACGRGGDLRKWFDRGLDYVYGVDLSPGRG
jgi:mRNA (guanine-N7-)-methyltransferase